MDGAGSKKWTQTQGKKRHRKFIKNPWNKKLWAKNLPLIIRSVCFLSDCLKCTWTVLIAWEKKGLWRGVLFCCDLPPQFPTYCYISIYIYTKKTFSQCNQFLSRELDCADICIYIFFNNFLLQTKLIHWQPGATPHNRALSDAGSPVLWKVWVPIHFLCRKQTNKRCTQLVIRKNLFWELIERK